MTTLALPPLAGMALVGGALGGMMLGLRALRGRVHPELIRKLLHVGMGLVTLTFPWLFAERWPVAVLGGLATALMLLLRQSSAVRARLGGVVDGVERQARSLGEVYYPVGVAALFWFSAGDPIAFCVPLLMLSLGDAVAALVGVRYGTLHYTTDDGRKSWEGSAAFFLVAFLSVHVPLLLFSDTGRAESLFIGLILGLLVMLVEAAAWRGLDNLFIPLGGFLLLQSFRQLDLGQLGVRLLVTVFLVLFALAWRRRTTLNHSAVLGAALIGFVAWAVGGWRWLVPPLTLFSLYALLFPLVDADGTRHTHDIHDVVNATGVGLFWLFASSTLGRPELLLPYTVAFGSHLAIIGIVRYQASLGEERARRMLAPAVLRAGAALLIPYALLETLVAPTFPAAALRPALPLALAGVLIAVLGERYGRGGLAGVAHPRRLWIRQAGVFVGSALPLLFLTMEAR